MNIKHIVLSSLVIMAMISYSFWRQGYRVKIYIEETQVIELPILSFEQTVPLSFEEMIAHEQTVPFEQTVPLRVNYKTLNDAALRGRPNDQFQMGLAYDQGNVPGVLQDHKAAWLWYIRAAEQGHAQAQNSLGGIYETKHKNKVVAHMWYNLAASNGSEQALTNRDRLSDYMTEIEIAKAQLVARICKSRSYKGC